MTELTPRRSYVEHIESDPNAAIDLAAARAEVRVTHLLRRALEVSGKKQQQVADLLNVTPGRVSQIFSSNGNLKVTTIARYLRALGYSLKLEAVPVDPGASRLERPLHRSRKSKQSDPHLFAVADKHTGELTKLLVVDAKGVENPTAGEFEYIGKLSDGRGTAHQYGSTALTASSGKNVQSHVSIKGIRYEM